MATVQAVLDDVWFLLNDVDGTHPVFSQTKMLVAMNRAYRDLQRRCHLENIQVLSEVSAVETVTAGTTSKTGADIAADFIMPIWLGERAASSSDLFAPMVERDWEPEAEQGETLRWWTWREEELKFLGATTDREVKVRYVKGLTAFTAGALNSAVGISESQDYLSARAASLVAGVIGENWTRAAELDKMAEMALEDFLSINAKKRQNIPVRRLGFRRPRNRYRA